uniref:Uncharacterized protein n=1 Tax=Plectus sambesii TaxID=2011161 RepID=A0A914WBL9_9BILA
MIQPSPCRRLHTTRMSRPTHLEPIPPSSQQPNMDAVLLSRADHVCNDNPPPSLPVPPPSSYASSRPDAIPQRLSPTASVVGDRSMTAAKLASGHSANRSVSQFAHSRSLIATPCNEWRGDRGTRRQKRRQKRARASQSIGRAASHTDVSDRSPSPPPRTRLAHLGRRRASPA